MRSRLLALSLIWLALTAATPLPFKPPPQDITGLVPWAAPPLDKPPLELPRLTLPPAPVDAGTVVAAPIVPPPAPKPMAALPEPRTLPCVGAWLRIAAESLECGRARILKREWEEAAKALEHATRNASDHDVLTEARYWHGEVLYVLDRTEQADWAFRQVLQDRARGEFGPWALHGTGWSALRLGDGPRAESAFRALLKDPHPVPLDSWGRHGLALALYLQSRWQDAEKVWAELAGRKVPPTLERDVTFYHGDVLGRLGQPAKAVEKITRFIRGGPHPLLAVSWVRLGWWQFTAGAPADAATSFRKYLGGFAGPVPPGTAAREREWSEAGLAMALLATGDTAGARAALGGLDRRGSTLALPARLRLAVAAVDRGKGADALTITQDLLSSSLTPPVRAWVLVVKGEAHRIEGDRDEARTQFELARNAQPGTDTARFASWRLAITNFELREFPQALNDIAPLLSGSSDPAQRVAALFLEGEAAYQAGNYQRAAAAYRRLLVEFPTNPQAAAVRLALGWTALRQGQRDAALQQFVEFARDHPKDPRAVDALLLGAELSEASNPNGAREMLDRIIANHPYHARVEFARLNRAILLTRAERFDEAERELTAWISRAPFPALVGRAWAALGVARLAKGKVGEAGPAFRRAQSEGMPEFAKLGLGTIALIQERWDDAGRDLTEARDTGTAAITQKAEYGLGVVGFHKGQRVEFKPAAQATLAAAPRAPASAPRLLYVLVGIAVEEKDWAGAMTQARRLITDFGQDPAADDALERIGAGASAAGAWPAAADAYTLLRQQYPQSPFVADSRYLYAEALLQTGRQAEAKRTFEEFLAASPKDPRAPTAWMTLARARESAGDKSGAIEAFGRAAQAGATPATHRDGYVAYARALSSAQRWDESRGVLNRLLATADAAAAPEVAVAIGDTWVGQGNQVAAAEY
ncbi:MAG TPA: tetratricopeptide repeat protein, partial [Methylomirabilota bacterium]